MQLKDLDIIVKDYINTVPDEIYEHVEDVDLIAVQSVSDARAEVEREEWKELFEDLGEQGKAIPEDCRAVFMGLPLERQDEAEGAQAGDEGPSEYEPAAGFILLIADNLPDDKAARIALMHEVGHALGMDEQQVDALGLNQQSTSEKPVQESA